MLLVLGANLSKGPGGGVSVPNLLLAVFLKYILFFSLVYNAFTFVG